LSAGRRIERWSWPDAHGSTAGRPFNAGTEESVHVLDRDSLADTVTLPPWDGSFLGVTEKLRTAGAAADMVEAVLWEPVALAPAGGTAARAEAVMAATSSSGKDRKRCGPTSAMLRITPNPFAFVSDRG
jgi:hypothetical protein